jgi:hypothetical protein
MLLSSLLTLTPFTSCEYKFAYRSLRCCKKGKRGVNIEARKSTRDSEADSRLGLDKIWNDLSIHKMQDKNR